MIYDRKFLELCQLEKYYFNKALMTSSIYYKRYTYIKYPNVGEMFDFLVIAVKKFIHKLSFKKSKVKENTRAHLPLN